MINRYLLDKRIRCVCLVDTLNPYYDPDYQGTDSPFHKFLHSGSEPNQELLNNLQNIVNQLNYQHYINESSPAGAD